MKPSNYQSDDHVLFAGMLLGLAWRHRLPVSIVTDDDGDYLPQWTLDMPGLPNGVKLTVHVPPPPADTNLSAWLDGVVNP